DPSEPVLDLIEPGRIGRGKVQMDIGMLGEEFADALGLMSGGVIEDDVDLASGRFDGDELAEEGDELLRRVPRCGLTEHRSSAGVEGRVERESPVAVVLEAVSLGTPGREGQDGIETIERLDRGLLIDAENGRVLRGVGKETDY